jgi:nucleoside-diphosphate-sugar epimerase
MEFRAVNLNLTISLAKESRKQGVKKFVFLSSVKIVGEKPGINNEKIQPEPTDPYVISKRETEQELRELFSQQTNTQCIILRLPKVYGENNKGNMLSLLNAASEKIPLPLAAARGKRNMVYVKNFTSALLRIMQDKTNDRPTVQTYFLSDGLDMTSGELYSSIYQCMNSKRGVINLPEYLFRIGGKIGSGFNSWFNVKLPISNEIISRLFDEYRFSSKEFCQDYGWAPPFKPEGRIKNTVIWYLKDRATKTI